MLRPPNVNAELKCHQTENVQSFKSNEAMPRASGTAWFFNFNSPTQLPPMKLRGTPRTNMCTHFSELRRPLREVMERREVVKHETRDGGRGSAERTTRGEMCMLNVFHKDACFTLSSAADFSSKPKHFLALESVRLQPTEESSWMRMRRKPRFNEKKNKKTPGAFLTFVSLKSNEACFEKKSIYVFFYAFQFPSKIYVTQMWEYSSFSGEITTFKGLM